MYTYTSAHTTTFCILYVYLHINKKQKTKKNVFTYMKFRTNKLQQEQRKEEQAL